MASNLGVGFISISDALDPSTVAGKAMISLLAIFADFERDILGERVSAGIAYAREQGKPHGRPKTAALKQDEVKNLFQQGCSKAKIAKQLNIGRSSVTRMLRGISTNQQQIKKIPAKQDNITSKEIAATNTTQPINSEKNITILLSVYIENNSKFVRGKSKTKDSIDFYLTIDLGAEKIDDDEYKFIVSYKNDEDLDDQVYDVLSELQSIADYRYCFSESSAVSEDGKKHW